MTMKIDPVPPHRWKAQEEQFVIERLEAGMRIFEIAREMGFRYKVVETKVQHLRRAGMTRRAHRSWPEELKDQLVELVRTGHTAREIAQIMGKTVQSVRTKMGTLQCQPGNDFYEESKENIRANLRFVNAMLKHHADRETPFR